MMKKFIFKLTKVFKKHGASMATGSAMALAVASSIFTRESTIKAIELKKKAEEEKGDDLTTTESIVVQVPSYIPAILSTGGTILMIFTSHYLNKKRQAQLLASAVMITEMFNKYRKTVIDKYGEEYDKTVRDTIAEQALAESESPSDDLQLFYDELTGDIFESTMEEVLVGIHEFERRLCTVGSVSVNEYREYLGMNLRDDCYNVGWNIGDVSEWSGEFWMDVGFDKITTKDDITCTKICLAMPPKLDYEEYGEGKMIFWPSMVDEDTYLKQIYDRVTREISESYNGKEETT